MTGAGWISQRAIITLGDVRARRCVGPLVLDEIWRDYTAIDQIIRPTPPSHPSTPQSPPSFLCKMAPRQSALH